MPLRPSLHNTTIAARAAVWVLCAKTGAEDPHAKLEPFFIIIKEDLD